MTKSSKPLHFVQNPNLYTQHCVEPKNIDTYGLSIQSNNLNLLSAVSDKKI